MKNYILSILLVCSTQMFGQNNAPNIIGLNFSGNNLTPVSLVPNSGKVQFLKNSPSSQDGFNSGNSCLDAENGIYYYLRGNPQQLVSYNVKTQKAKSTYVTQIPNSILPITNIRFNKSDGLIYGLNFKNGSLFMASLDPSDGTITQIGSTKVSSDLFQTGDAAFDEKNGRYYYLRGGTYKELITVSIKNGKSKAISLKTDSLINSNTFFSLQYSNSLNKIVGLVMESSNLYFSTIDTSNGQINVLRSIPNSGDQLESGVCALDENYNNYYYMRRSGVNQQIVCVDILTGKNKFISVVTNGSGILPITNIEYYNPELGISRFDYISDCGNPEINFKNLGMGDSFLWDFGDGKFSTDVNPTHTFSFEGIYKVKLISYGTTKNDTSIQEIIISSPYKFDLGEDKQLYSGDKIELQVPSEATNIKWSNGSKDFRINVYSGSLIDVSFEVGNCKVSDQIRINEQNPLLITDLWNKEETSESNYKIQYKIINNSDSTLSFRCNLESGSFSTTGWNSKIEHSSGLSYISNLYRLDVLPNSIDTLSFVINTNNIEGWGRTKIRLAKYDDIEVYKNLNYTLYKRNNSVGLRDFEPSLQNPVLISNSLRNGEIMKFKYQENLRQLNIYSSDGRLIHKKNTSFNSIKAPSKAGIYFIKVNNLQTQRFIVH